MVKLSKGYQVPVNGREVSCHGETVHVASKKHGTKASACSPIDIVSVAGFVMVPKFKWK
jgi:hypothetical protein